MYLTLTELPDHYKEALRNGTLKIGHIQEAMKLMDPVEIDAALQSALTHGWNVKVMKYYVEQRLADLERAKAAGDREFLETPPSPQYAQQIVQYGDCMICKRKIKREDLSMPTVCPDCRSLLEWIVEQLGDPKEAMQTIYNALNLYFDVTRREAREQIAAQQQSAAYQQQNVMQQQHISTAQQQNAELSESDIRLIRLIKLLKNEGVL